jgi:molecular chaperone GrpE
LARKVTREKGHKRKEAGGRADGKDRKGSEAKAAHPDAEIRDEELQTRIQELEDEATRLRAELEAASDQALRTLADFENYRRRMNRGREEAAELATAIVLQELLEVADNFDRALEHAGEDVPESFLVGMRLTQQGLHDLLDRRGVVRFQSVGERFDPEKHEALASQPAPDAEPNVILQEVKAGYMMGERVLRPAKVIVSRAE